MSKTVVTVEPTPRRKVSASKLGFDVEKCPRCFYLSAVTGLEVPGSPVSSIFSKLEKATKELIAGRKLSEVFDGAPEATIEKSNSRSTSLPIFYEDLNIEIEISCQADSVVKFDDGTRGIIMFKTSDPTKNLEAYIRQLHACAYAIENSTKPENRLEITTLGIIMFDPIAHWQGAKAEDTYKWFPVKYDMETFEKYVEEIASLLTSDYVPDFTDTCEVCKRDKGILARYGIEVNR